MMRSLVLAARFLRRDFRAGELQVLLFAVIIAVAAVTSVGFFTNRIHLALSQQANELLGADLSLVSDHDIDVKYVNHARELGLGAVHTQSFPSMAISENDNQLAMLKAVEDSFPLRGSIKIADAPFAPERIADHGPVRGTVWIDPRLLQALQIQVGDEIGLGASSFRVAAVITNEPGRGANLFSIAPRVMLNLADLPATQLVQPASRVQYNLLVAGDRADVSHFKQFVEKQNERGMRMQDINDAQPEIRVALTRAQQFLGLAALTSVILAGVAIALAARRYAQRHLDQCAIMRCVGATQMTVAQIYISQILLLGLIASTLGVLLGWLAHGLLIEALGALVGVDLPAPSILPGVGGFATGFITLVAFSLPPLLQLQNVPALRVLRRDMGALKAPGWFVYIVGVAVLGALMVWQAGEIKLGLYMTIGTALALVVLTLIAVLLLQLLKPIRSQARGSWLFGLANLLRRRNASVMQIVAFGLGIMALLLLTVVRGDLLDQWGKSLPADAPNRFLINIQPDQVAALETFMATNGFAKNEIYPMIRGRLVKINGDTTNSDRYDDDRAKRLVEREFNLSWAEHLAADNKITQGEWWDATEKGKTLWSIESGIAKTLGVKLGDEMTFKIGADEVVAKVANVRDVNWDSFHPNFFVLASPGLLDPFPATYMTSFYLPIDRYALLTELVKQFPNITVIDVAAIMEQVRNIINRVTLAVEYVFLFTLAAGVMVLFAGIQTTHDERLLENAIVRTLGGSRAQIRDALLGEFVAMGFFAGVLASLLASVLSYVIADRVLNMPFYFNPTMWLFGIVGGALGVGLAGWIGSRSVMNRPPIQTLRKLA